MEYWIYKCNSRQHPHQVAWGDWNEFLKNPGEAEWGSTEWVPKLSEAKRGDVILAYQTDRNELVGVTRVVRLQPRGNYRDLILEPLEELRVKVRPLKQRSSAIARIPALQPGPIRTLYRLSSSEAARLLAAAQAQYQVEPGETEVVVTGGGFGTAEGNKEVEQAAVKYVCGYYLRRGWKVHDVSDSQCGYDLECCRGRDILHVEVKGTRSDNKKFIITHNEAERWKIDKHFLLELVTNALDRPKLFQFKGPSARTQMELRPVAYVCMPKGIPGPGH